MALQSCFLLRLSATLTVTALSAAALPAHAQPAATPSTVLTLGDAVRHGLAHAPAVRGAAAAIAAAEAGAQGARLLPNPTFSVEAENVFGSGPYARLGRSETTYTLSMPLELGGKRAARTRVALAEGVYARVGADAARAEAALKVTQAFIALAAGERRLQAARNRQQLAERSEHEARAMVRAGKMSAIDEQRAAAQRISATVAAERAGRALELARSSLARLTGVPAPYAIAAHWFDSPAVEPALEAHAIPPLVAAAQARFDAAGARVDAARRARIPDISISAGTRRFRESGDSAAVLTLSVPLPVFNRGHAELSRARAELDRAEAERSAVALEFDEALAAARVNLADARAAAASASGPELAAAQEAARIARIAHAEGQLSQLDLIEAESQLSQTQEAAIDALAALHDAHARLAHMLGSTAALYKD